MFVCLFICLSVLACREKDKSRDRDSERERDRDSTESEESISKSKKGRWNTGRNRENGFSPWKLPEGVIIYQYFLK